MKGARKMSQSHGEQRRILNSTTKNLCRKYGLEVVGNAYLTKRGQWIKKVGNEWVAMDRTASGWETIGTAKTMTAICEEVA